MFSQLYSFAEEWDVAVVSTEKKKSSESLNCSGSLAEVGGKKGAFNRTESRLDKLHSSNDKPKIITPGEIILDWCTTICLIYTKQTTTFN